MFAKVFGQIFDSSIAEDYNCRRMFMDLLVLADPDGVVDMTLDAIARRTNVPLQEVTRYIVELQQPDALSRSRAEEGRRLVPIDTHRDWGWRIVNYHHYRKIRDDEIRRQYFRDKMRRYRELKKRVKYKGLTGVNKAKHKSTTSNNLSPPASSSASSCTHLLPEGVRGRFGEWMKFRKGLGHKPADWETMFAKQAQWLLQFNEKDQLAILDQSIRNGWRGLFELKGGGNAPAFKGGVKDLPSVWETKEKIKAIDEELGKTYWERDKPEVAERRKELHQRKKELQKGLTQ